MAGSENPIVDPQEKSEKKTIKPEKRLSTQAGVRVDRKTPVCQDL